MGWKDLLDPETGESPREHLERKGGEKEYTDIGIDREDFEEYLEEMGWEFGIEGWDYNTETDKEWLETSTEYEVETPDGEEIHAVLVREGSYEIIDTGGREAEMEYEPEVTLRLVSKAENDSPVEQTA